MQKREEDMYNVSTYTDSELYDILDLSNPTDRELEAKIIFLYRKYKNMQNDSGDELAAFFNNIYNHFFDTKEDEEEDETEDNNDEENINTNSKEGMTTLNEINRTQNITKPNLDTTTDSRTLVYDNALVSNLLTGNVSYSTDYGNSFVTSNTIPPVPSDSFLKTEQVNFVKQVDFKPDNLNPLLQQTITRVISIDSQYRANKTALSTEFTFDLSDPLKDVVSLSLYSVQIPYTWYTIAKSYGSNFFYLKGNSPGINNGNHDIQISIEPGNYSPTELATAVNNSIKKKYTLHNDVSFASTNIFLNTASSLTTMTVDLTNQYSENSYELNFNNWSSPNIVDPITKTINDASRVTISIPTALGFNQASYQLNTLNTSLFTGTDIANNDFENIKIDPLSTTFYIIKYISIVSNGKSQLFNNSEQIDQIIPITLSLLTNGEKYSRNEILLDISNQLFNNQYLSNESYFSKITITDASDVRFSLGPVYYQLKIKPNRYTTNNTTNSKIFIQFPDETNILPTNTRIWTNSNNSTSVFRFLDISNDLQFITAETPIIQQTNLYDITKNPIIPYVFLKCINPDFSSNYNDVSFSLQPNQVNNTNKYTLPEMIDSINAGIINVSSNYPFLNSPPNLLYNYDINSPKPPIYTYAYLDSNFKFSLAIDIEKDFGNQNYLIDFRDTSFNTLFELGNDYNINLSNISNSNLTDISSNNANAFDTKTIKNGSILFKIKPNTNISDLCGNTFDTKFRDIIYNTTNTFYDYNTLATNITSYLINYTYQGKQLFTNNTSFKINVLSNTKVQVLLNVYISRKITSADYSIRFFENTNPLAKFWSNPLNIDASFIDVSYNLGSNISTYAIQSPNSNIITVKGNTNIQSNVINFVNYPNISNTFSFRAYEDGVYSSGNENNIVVTIPKKDSGGNSINYTRDLLISTINNILASDSRAYGTYFYLSSPDTNNNYYLKIRPNINKIYRASDYKVVFYDTLSFVQCFIGAKGVQNTTWDSTLGWILGFRTAISYALSSYTPINNIISIIGDTGVSTNLFNYFLISLDDYNLNHLNDGLVTITGQDTTAPLPSYADRTNFQCDPATGKLTYNYNSPTTNDQYSNLTENQLYSLIEKANAKNKTTSNILGGQNYKSFGKGPFSEDVFAVIPMKLAGLQNGQYFVEYGGTLQSNSRLYIGPVNINRMKIKLISDKGNTVDLNGANWSFSFLCQQLYKQNGNNNAKKSK